MRRVWWELLLRKKDSSLQVGVTSGPPVLLMTEASGSVPENSVLEQMVRSLRHCPEILKKKGVQLYPFGETHLTQAIEVRRPDSSFGGAKGKDF